MKLYSLETELVYAWDENCLGLSHCFSVDSAELPHGGMESYECSMFFPPPSLKKYFYVPFFS